MEEIIYTIYSEKIEIPVRYKYERWSTQDILDVYDRQGFRDRNVEFVTRNKVKAIQEFRQERRYTHSRIDIGYNNYILLADVLTLEEEHYIDGELFDSVLLNSYAEPIEHDITFDIVKDNVRIDSRDYYDKYSIADAIMYQFDLDENTAYNYAEKITMGRIVDDFIDIYNRMTNEERADDNYVIDEIMSYYTGDEDYAKAIYRQIKELLKGWTMECRHHNYLSLFYDDKFIYCYDNTLRHPEPRKHYYYTENIIDSIEKRTGMKITDIPIRGSVEDFDGMRFLNGGFKKGHEWLNKNQELW